MCAEINLLLIIGLKQMSESAVADHPYIIRVLNEITDIHHWQCFSLTYTLRCTRYLSLTLRYTLCIVLCRLLLPI